MSDLGAALPGTPEDSLHLILPFRITASCSRKTDSMAAGDPEAGRTRQNGKSMGQNEKGFHDMIGGMTGQWRQMPGYFYKIKQFDGQA